MELTASGIKDLVTRPTADHPVTSVFLNTDGAVFPKAADYELRLEALLKGAIASAGAQEEAAERDAEEIRRWVSDEFNRDGVKGLAIFASDGEIFDGLHTASAFRNVARVGDTPYVVPLQAMLGRFMHIGLAVIERDSARLFRYRLGRMVEYHTIDSDVPGQSDGGGWSQGRIARNVENAVHHHFKEAAEEFRGVHAEDPFDALVLAGTHVEVEQFKKSLHPYLAAVVHGTVSGISATSTKEELLEAFATVEQERVSARRQELLDRLAAGAGQAESVARGIDDVINACNERRVETLFVVEGSGSPGFRSGTGMLTKDRAAAQAFGGPVQPVDDLIDEVIEQCVLTRAKIELFRDSTRLDGEPIAALLRF